MELLILFAVLAWPVVQFVVLPLRIWRVSPPRDALRIKRDFEGQGRRVTEVRRTGTRWGGRSVPTHRKYAATVERHDGQAATFQVQVQFTLGSDPSLVIEDERAWKTFSEGSRSFFLPE